MCDKSAEKAMSGKARSLIIIFGAIFPFIPELVILEFFGLLVPFAIFFFISFLFLIISFFGGNISIRSALFVFSLIPCFLLSQIGSTFIVDKVQRVRCESLVTEIETIRNKTGTFPDHYPTYVGITYVKTIDQASFRIKYSRGFLVTEVYNYDDKTCISRGWND